MDSVLSFMWWLINDMLDRHLPSAAHLNKACFFLIFQTAIKSGPPKETIGVNVGNNCGMLSPSSYLVWCCCNTVWSHLRNPIPSLQQISRVVWTQFEYLCQTTQSLLIRQFLAQADSQSDSLTTYLLQTWHPASGRALAIDAIPVQFLVCKPGPLNIGV